MPSSEETSRYTKTAIALHWLIAAAVVGLIGWGWWMQTIPKLPVGPRVDAFNLHKSIGLTVLLLMLVRIGWRVRHPPPPFPPMPPWQAGSPGRCTSRSMCLTCNRCPLLGSAFAATRCAFGVVLPAWAPRNDAVKDALSVVHLVNSWVLVGALALHLAGNAKHALLEHDGSFRRIWPWRPRTASTAQAGRTTG
jgi:cytochrome b561